MSERTFNPASADIDLATDATCQDCGKERWEHRDGGMVYGLICPARSTPVETLDVERLALSWFIGIQARSGIDRDTAIRRWKGSATDPDVAHLHGVYGDVAEKAADEYARLRSPESD